MDEAQSFQLDLTGQELHRLPTYRRLGALNGLLIGLALGLGAWGIETLRVARLPFPLAVPSYLVGIVAITALGALVGWLSARIARTWLTVLLWLAAGVLISLIIGYLPFYGRTLMVWLADPRFFGRPVYPNTLGGSDLGLVLSGLAIIILLAALGLLQGNRLDNLTSEVQHTGALKGRAWWSLLWPLPIFFLAALATANAMVDPAATAGVLTHHAILRAQSFEGDLRDLPAEAGISYLALRPVHDRLGGPFTLGVVDVNLASSIVTVAANFDSGQWIHCSVINDQLNFCYDATPVYVDGLRGLITGEAPPADCHSCNLTATDEAAAWLAERAAAFDPQPVVAREAQWGNVTLMTITGDSLAAECWVEGVAPPVVTSCAERE